MLYTEANRLRFCSDSKQGHYESYFLRANHPSKKQAFWLRYTIFLSSDKKIELAEIWGAFFNNDDVIAIQQDIPLSECNLTDSQNKIQLRNNVLKFALMGKGSATGEVTDESRSIGWHLNYSGETNVLPLLPAAYYQRSLPKAKVLVGIPQAFFDGQLNINGETIIINNWQGSENHNWGSKHTDEYAWGQVSGFDGKPNSFLECSTARIKIGPLWSPKMSLAVLRIDQQEYRFNGLWQAMKNQGSYRYFDWSMQCKNNNFTLDMNMNSQSHDMAGLNYRNPPGGSHTCLNSKVARCEVILKKNGKVLHHLQTQHRAAFEILTDDTRHHIRIQNGAQ